jgi:hypothetical protein
MSKYSIEVQQVIHAPPPEVYAILIHLEDWKNWTPTINRISLMDNAPFAVGSTAKILQPKLPPAEWTITDIQPDKSFTWTKKSFGLEIIAVHLVRESPEGSVFKNSIEYRGFMAALAYFLTRSLTRNYLTREAEGLKRACEKNNK